MKPVAILGSTGSIGTQTLDVVRMYPDRFCVTGLACLRNVRLLEEQIREFRPSYAAVFDEAAASELRVRVADTDTQVLSGMEGLLQLVTEPEPRIVVTGIVGMIGIRPTVAAIRAGKDIALANKETLVTAGHRIMPLAKSSGVRILPVDSEHSAIFQALQGRAGSKIRRILLTASGGPFYGKKKEELALMTAAEALRHPNWEMGAKVTIDSATMVNKGLEFIEARWLFDVRPDQIEVLIQRESLIHSAVEYEDGSILAQVGPPDMRIPIQYALTYPEHVKSPAEPLDFSKIAAMHISRPDDETFRGLPLARRALEIGGTMPAVFNAANEWANRAFREGRIRFLEIYDLIEEAMADHRPAADPSVDEIFEAKDAVFSRWNGRFGVDYE